MGNWQLEVAKMCIYMFFPVGCFHYFNQPENFEEWVVRVRREMLYTETKEVRENFRKIVEEFAHEERLKTVEALEASEKKFNELKAKRASQSITKEE